jgi:hypothetical protein
MIVAGSWWSGVERWIGLGGKYRSLLFARTVVLNVVWQGNGDHEADDESGEAGSEVQRRVSCKLQTGSTGE